MRDFDAPVPFIEYWVEGEEDEQWGEETIEETETEAETDPLNEEMGGDENDDEDEGGPTREPEPQSELHGHGTVRLDHWEDTGE